jgi:hypothetical protein
MSDSQAIERISWAIGILEREIAADCSGKVEIHLELGKITRIRIDKSEYPAGGFTYGEAPGKVGPK